MDTLTHIDRLIKQHAAVNPPSQRDLRWSHAIADRVKLSSAWNAKMPLVVIGYQ